MVMLVALLEGCASALSDGAAGQKQTQMEQSVRKGTVKDVRNVRLSANSGAGATIGAIAASTQEGTTGKPGLDVTVRLDNGAVVAVVQDAGEKLSVGDRVRIVSGNGASRVLKNDAP